MSMFIIIINVFLKFDIKIDKKSQRKVNKGTKNIYWVSSLKTKTACHVNV